MTKKSKQAQSNVTALAKKVQELTVADKKLKRRLRKRSNKKAEPMQLSAKSIGQFGPVSSITTAPVAIGNSVRGSNKQISRTPRGVIISGRDFMFAPIGTTTNVNTWTCVGGTPLTPAAFADSVIANYQRMYMKFRFRSFIVHYITSSSTSSTGDVMFYYSKDRSSVYLNQTSSQLLPFVFTDQNTVLGPQWTNHSAKFSVTGDWKLTDYGMHDGIEEYADGEVFLLSKTTTTDSPGYVIFDYVVEFAEESFQPRLLLFPIPRIQWKNTCLGWDAINPTKGTTSFYTKLYGNDLTGQTASLTATNGDIFKIIVDLTNSTTTVGNAAWTTATAANLIELEVGGAETAITLTDGFTCYGVYNGTNLAWYSNATNAFSAYNFNASSASGSSLRYGLTGTGIAFTLQCWVSYIGSYSTTANIPNY